MKNSYIFVREISTKILQTMKIKIIYLVLICLFSCSSKDKLDTGHDDTNSEMREDSITKESILEIEDGLEKFFIPETIKQIKTLNAELKSISNNTELADLLEKSYKLSKKLTSELETANTNYLKQLSKANYSDFTAEVLDELKLYENQLSPIVAECGGECASVEFMIKYSSFQKFTKKTKSNVDDEFINILKRFYGESGNPPYFNDEEDWFDRISDEETYYAFGNNKLFEAFEMLSIYRGNYPNMFAKELSSIEKQVIESLTHDLNFSNSKEQVLEELNRIIDLNLVENKNNEAKLLKQIEIISKLYAPSFSFLDPDNVSYDSGEE